MLQRLLVWGIAIVILSASVEICGIRAQQSKAPPVSKAVYWVSQEPEAEVSLVEKGDGDFRMLVVSKKDLKVTYHTSINSSKPVDNELMPVNSGGIGVRIYEFKHHFSRTTIWMAIEFTLNGESVSGLTRTFSNNISTVVPNGIFNYGTVKRP
jgi:hypothetical protein